MKNKTKRLYSFIALLLFLLGAGCLAFGLYGLLWTPGGLSLGVVDGDILVEIPADQLPEDVLYISYHRRQYGGDMRLVIPAIGVDTGVGDSTVPEALRLLPGLYEFSQMPGEAGGNVSIAGHRDIYNMVFYDLHLLAEGHLMHLVHDDLVYTYEYKNTVIVQPDDWSVIKRQGQSALTLTTCDPIGTTWKRMIVTGRLTGVAPYEGEDQLQQASR